MSEEKGIGAGDIAAALGALAIILLVALVGVAALVILAVFGWPLLAGGVVAGLLGFGALGLLALAFGLLVAFVSVWYVLYALLKNYLGPQEKPAPPRDYTLDRVRKSE